MNCHSWLNRQVVTNVGAAFKLCTLGYTSQISWEGLSLFKADRLTEFFSSFVKKKPHLSHSFFLNWQWIT